MKSLKKAVDDGEIFENIALRELHSDYEIHSDHDVHADYKYL